MALDYGSKLKVYRNSIKHIKDNNITNAEMQ